MEVDWAFSTSFPILVIWDLGAGDEKDTAVITYLRDKVFKDYFQAGLDLGFSFTDIWGFFYFILQ